MKAFAHSPLSMDDRSLPASLDFAENELAGTIYRPNHDDYMFLGTQYVPHRGLVRYSQALKHLIPVRKEKSKKNVLNVDNAGFFSFLTFSWMTKYIWQAYKTGLTLEDIPTGSPYDACSFNAERMEVLWSEEVAEHGKKNASLGRVIWRFARTRCLLASLTFSISCLLGFLSPTIFMRKLLEFSERDDRTWQEGVIWAVALALSELLRTLFFCLCWSISYRTATRLRAACLAMVYRKILTLHSLGNKSTGEIINLFANDGPRLFYMVVFGPMVLAGPLVATCGFIYILSVLGSWALFGMLAFILFYPLQYGLSHLTGYYRGRGISVADLRVKIMNELLNSIKVIKMYAWEDAFSEKVLDTRKDEIHEIKRCTYYQSLGITMAPMVPAISGIVTFVAHVLAGGNLTASQAFPVLSFTTKQIRMALKHLSESCTALQYGLVSIPRFQAFPLVTILLGQLRAALMNVRYGTENLLVGAVVIKRIQELLLLDALEVSIMKPKDSETALEVIDGTFLAAELPQTDDNGLRENGEKEKLNVQETLPLLSNASLSIRKGTLIGVCGVVGSGKSSLLLGLLGQLKMASGQLFRDGSVAYVSQVAWIQNATFKENIVFGEPFNAKRYINTLHCCALNEDVHLLPGGDETQIGERGVNLSGGQKQRVALARAVYANRDIYFLDDPLSAVDAHVGAHIMDHAILGALKQHTVILVTHHVSHLMQCDSVLVVKDRQVVAQGSHVELMEQSPDYRLIIQASEFTDINLKGGDIGSCIALDQIPNSVTPAATDFSETKKPPPLVTTEEQLRGDVRSYAYTAYLNAAGGPIVCFLVLFSIFVNTGTNAFASYWLAEWIRQGGGNTTIFDPITNTTQLSTNINDNPDLSWYMWVYGGIIGLILLSSVGRSVAVAQMTVQAGRRLHDALFAATMRSPIRYFETTPLGRILNVFARDLDDVENRLPALLETLIQNIWVVMFSFLFITLVFPWFLLPLIFIAIIYYYISKIFRVAVRDLQRMDNISRAPVLSSVSASIQGLSTIHAFGKEKNFLSQFSKSFDENSTCLFMNCNAMRWMATRLDSISVAITCLTGLLVVALKGQVPAALCGLALTYSSMISGVFQYTIRLLSETESKFISVERIQTSIKTLSPEGRGCVDVPPPNWPTKGAIKFKDVCLSYGENLPRALDSFSISVRGGEKLGVVGRTGAGKSSIITALFRLSPLSQGSILIDGIDIEQINLKLLREVMAIIPQDPVLFNGSFRYNLDPFGQYSEEELWNCVVKTKLERKVRSLDGGLDALVGEGGDGLSVGEKQLVCLARALLRKSKILVLDEATASVDPETEQAIQQTIRTEFSSSTVITIAHRLATVTSTNRVLLMDQGRVVELDDPSALLSDRNSQFAKLAASVGFIPSS